jgi:hypothetical protein
MDLPQSALDKFGREHDLEFGPAHRHQILGALRRFAEERQRYEGWGKDEKHRRAGEKRHLEKIVTWAAKGVGLIGELQKNYPGAWDRLAADGANGWPDLEILRESSDLLAKRRFRAPPHHPILWRLLISLERIFREAGGISTGVHHGRRPRHGPFLNFADFAISHLPRNIRPGSLGSPWEEFFSGRRTRRGFQLSMFSPGLSDITFTSRRERRRERPATRRRPETQFKKQHR